MDPFSATIMGGSAILGGVIGAKSQEAANKANIDWSRNRIWYTKQDALKSGIHPVAALGANFGSGPSIRAGTDGQAIARAGQAIGDAMLQKEVIRGQKLDNDLKQKQIDNFEKSLVAKPTSSDVVDKTTEELVPAQRTVGLTRDSDIDSFSARHGEIIGEGKALLRSAVELGPQVGLNTKWKTNQPGRTRVRQGWIQKLNSRGRWVNIRRAGQ